jgi:hypothetical protein
MSTILTKGALAKPQAVIEEMKPVSFSIFLFVCCGFNRAVADAPNVVVIRADDLGWSDTTLFGMNRLYQTPNLDRLARCLRKLDMRKFITNSWTRPRQGCG